MGSAIWTLFVATGAAGEYLYASYRNVAALDLELSRMPLAEFVKYSAPAAYDYRESFVDRKSVV